MLLQIRVSQPLAKLSVPLKLNPVGLGWKQDTGDQPGIRAVVMTLLFSLFFSSSFFLFSYLTDKMRIGKHFLEYFGRRVDKKRKTRHSIRA